MAEQDLSWMITLPFRSLLKDEYVSWTFSFGEPYKLRVNSFWRLIIDGRVALTATDHGQRFGLPDPVDAVAHAHVLLREASITRARLEEALADLTLEFSNGAHLQVFNDSSGYEAWELVGPRRALVVAHGSNGAAIWSPEA